MNELQLKNAVPKEYFSKIVIGCAVLLFLIAAAYCISQTAYSAFNEDETIYYIGAKLFAETNSVKSHSIISENVSPVFEADWYGIFYPIFFGTIMKIVGTSCKAFIAINIGLYLLMIVMISKSRWLTKNEKLALLAITLSSSSLLRYSFYFMPMIFNTLLAFILLICLFKINEAFSKENTLRYKRAIAFYILIVLICSLFRTTYIFWIIGILPFSKGYQQFIRFTIISLIGILIIVVYMKFFNAPAYAPNMMVITHLFQHNYLLFLKGMVTNVIQNILNGPFNYKDMPAGLALGYYYTLLAPVYFTHRYMVKKRNNFLLAASLVCLFSNVITLFFYYLDPALYLRFSVQLLFVNCFIMIYDKNMSTMSKQVTTVAFLISSVITLTQLLNEFKTREKSAIAQKNDFYMALDDLKKSMDDQPVTTVLIDRNLLTKYPSRELEMSLPYTRENKHIIRYTYNIKEKDPLELHHKLKIDYILSIDSLKNPNFIPSHSNNHYFLYKLR